MIKKTIIIDAGHGYNTPGKRSEGFYDNQGRVLLKESSINEALANKLSLLFHRTDIDCQFITNEWYDVELSERVKREHLIAEKGESFLISLHADAFDKNRAQGCTFFYYSDSSRILAEKFTSFFTESDYDLVVRQSKQANFMILRETKSPALLFECGFMTTGKDLKFLLKDEFRNKTAVLLFKAIKEIILFPNTL